MSEIKTKQEYKPRTVEPRKTKVVQEMISSTPAGAYSSGDADIVVKSKLSQLFDVHIGDPLAMSDMDEMIRVFRELGAKDYAGYIDLIDELNSGGGALPVGTNRLSSMINRAKMKKSIVDQERHLDAMKKQYRNYSR